VLQALLLGTVVVGSLPAWGQSCVFTTSGGAVAFPTLDPSVATTQTAFTTVRIFCLPVAFVPAWQFSGTNGNVPLRMKHATQTAYIPYTVAQNSMGFVGFQQSWRLTATVLGQDYVDAFVGSYTDLLTATILP
jgi:hypothetical protein